MYRFAHQLYRCRWLVMLIWAVALAPLALLGSGLSSRLTDSFTLPGTQAQHVEDTLVAAFGRTPDATLQVVWSSHTRTVDDPRFAAIAQANLAGIQRRFPNARIFSYFNTGDNHLVSADRRLTFATLALPYNFVTVMNKVDAVRAAMGPAGDLQRELTGTPAIGHDEQPIDSNDLSMAERITLPVVILILLIAFGSLVSVSLPLTVAVSAIITALAGVSIVTHFMGMNSRAINVVTLIGLGIAIDYSLLLITRFREELIRHGVETKLPPKRETAERAAAMALRKQSVPEALGATMEYAGHAVIFSGVSVAIGLATLMLLPVPFLQSLGLAAILVPVSSVLVACTLLPALLAVLGPRVNRGNILPRRWTAIAREGEGLWARLATSIMAHPVRYLALGLAVILTLAAPVRDLTLAASGTINLPRTEAINGLLAIEAAVGAGSTEPVVVLVDAGHPGGLRTQGPAIDRLSTALAGVPGITRVLQPSLLQGNIDPTDHYALINLTTPIDPGSVAARDLISQVRQSVKHIDARGLAISVGGVAAFNTDFYRQIYDGFPQVILLVLIITYGVLLWAFRSVLLPFKAVLLNVLSLLAAFGTLVAVFQWGWGASLLHFHKEGLVASWLPAFLFAFLFGLSMDYEVFMVSRIREGWERGMGPTGSVAHGLARTGRLITCAAGIMVFAFGGFVVGQSVDLKMFGFGLAAAIFVDATIIRILMVPALMKLFGSANWWLPRSLARLLPTRISTLESEEGFAASEGAA